MAGSPSSWTDWHLNRRDPPFVNKPHCNDLHPTMKPVELVERAITNNSRKGNRLLWA